MIERNDGSGPVILFFILAIIGYFAAKAGIPTWLNIIGFIITFFSLFEWANSVKI